ncbi:GIY-YIG nuclease family protein [Microbacterium sp. cx-55]|uniref:GIY-YIG nuclease family protein n=1 Tax=Microbacterium sp. cx-55 TaxID=2875948 RepID=UPI001CBCF6FF|nr:GIY-YIG nuclease family protein [Microbacterium sp. cx-55]UGB36502.1 GIY-YIG nuclease family protein [Microbacterium sp. cx-55]
MPDERRSCAIADGCGGPVPAASPLPLCELHLALAAEASVDVHGETDLLPAPCRRCGSPLGARFRSGWICAVCDWHHGEVVDGELPAPRLDIVYYLGFRDRVKIGTTVNPRQRFAAIRHDRVLAFERGDRMREHLRHAQFAEERLGRSEWFVRSSALDAHIDTLRGDVNPWTRYAQWQSAALAVGFIG